MSNTSSGLKETPQPQAPNRFAVWVQRYFYLLLDDAVRAKDGIFNVPAEIRWVAVVRNFGGGWVAIRPLLNDEQASIEKQKGLQADLGRVMPSPDESIQWLLDIPERYHAKLRCNEREDSHHSARVHFTAPAQPDPRAAYPAAQLRYCYYLHLSQADQPIENQPVFNIPGKARWVLLRRQLRDGWAQIYQLTSDDVTENDLEKPFHVHLGKVVPKSPKDSWAQCILERYPDRLMREAELDHNKTKKNFDLETTRSLFKRIDAESPDHWVVANPKR